jgi:hypothetical protein
MLADTDISETASARCSVLEAFAANKLRILRILVSVSLTASGYVSDPWRKCNSSPLGHNHLCHPTNDRLCGLVVSVLGYVTEMYCFLWGTNWIYICYVEESRPPLWSSGQSSWLRNGDVLSFLRGTNWIYICYVGESRPPLWSSGQSSWLQNGDVLCFLWGTNWIYMLRIRE